MGSVRWGLVMLDEGKIIPRHESRQSTETAGVVSQDRGKVPVATQTRPIQIECLLNAPGEQRLFDQQFVLVQNGRVPWWARWPCLQAGRQFGAHWLMDRSRLRSQKIAEEFA